MSELAKRIHAVLFWKNEIMSKGALADMLEVDRASIDSAIIELKTRLSPAHSGVILVENGEEVLLGTHPDYASLIRRIEDEEYERDLSPGALETLAVVLYNMPIGKKSIDSIRGVNSSFILRNLQQRGLIEQRKDKSSSLYSGTTLLLATLGLTSWADLPEYAAFKKELSKINPQV